MGEQKVDDFKPNRSIDGMSGGGVPPRAPEQQPSDSNNVFSHNDPADLGTVDHQPADHYANHVNNLPISGNGDGSGKKFKVLTVIFVILFFAASAFAVYQYTQIQQLKKDVDTANNEIDKLKAENYSLSYDAKDNVIKNELLTKQVQELNDVAKQLKDTCGSRCNDISIPEL